MSKLLYITANVKEVKDSYSLSVGEEFLKEYENLNPTDEIIRLDLFKTEIPFLDEQLVGHVFGTVKYDEIDEEHKRKVQVMKSNLEQFIDADKYVFVTPLWNFSVPPVVRAYFDNVSVSGKTFKFTEKGHQGLLTGKKALCIQSSGGMYNKRGSQAVEHGVPYIKTILAFLGVVDVQAVFVEGVNMASNNAEQIKKEAIEEAQLIARNF